MTVLKIVTLSEDSYIKSRVDPQITQTASQDLQHPASLGLVEKGGTTGKGVFYRIAKGV